MKPCKQVIWVVNKTWLMGASLGKLGWPHTQVRSLGLVDCHVGGPNSVLNSSLSEIPLLEIVRAMLLVARVELRQEHHLVS